MINKGVSAVVYNPVTEKFLVMKRSDQNQYYPGVWQFPGGGLEDEKPEEGALRELREETGLEGEIVRGGSYRWISKHGKSEMKTFAFLVEVEETDVVLSWEHDEFRWIELDELRSMETFEFIEKDLEAVGVIAKDE